MSQDQKPVKEKSAKAPKPSNNAQGDDYIPRPDRSKFLESLKDLRKDLDTARAKLSKHRQEIEAQGTASQSPEETKLREEHAAILTERNQLRDAERKIAAEADRIEEGAKRKVAELQTLRPKNGPRSVKDLDAKVQQLEATMDSGSLSIVEEQKVLREVSALKKQRTSFGQADKLQAEVDELRKKAADLRKTVDQAGMRQVLARKSEIESKLDTFKESRQAHRSKMNTVYDNRRKVQAEIKELNSKIDELRKDFDQRMDDFNTKMKSRKEKREAEEKQAKVEQAKQRKLSEAKSKLAAAQEPAFSSHIEKAKSLLAFFDPASAETETGSAAASTEASATNGSKKPTQTLAPRQAPQAPPSRKSQKLKAKDNSANSNGKLQFDFGIVDALSSLNISLPTSSNDIASTAEKLKEKIAYYTENNERVTKEKVERAEKELKQVLASLEKEASPSTEKEAVEPAQAETKA